MKKLKFILCATLILPPSFSIAQEKGFSYASYMKPAFKGLGALACFWAAYKNAHIAYLGAEVFLDAYQKYNDIVKAGEDNSFFGGLAAHNHNQNMIIAKGYLFSAPIACVSATILGGMLVKSGYDDIRKIHAKNPKC